MPPKRKPAAPERPLATPKQLAEYLGGSDEGITENTLKDWRYKNVGPKWIPVGRHVFYDWGDVEAWIDAKRKGRDIPAQGAA